MANFGAYTLHEQLGLGERGAVHRATLAGGQRSVAIKRFTPSVIAGDTEAKRLAAAVSRVARLRHPNIVSTYRVGVNEGVAYVEMEHVNGISVEELLHDVRMGGPPPVDVVVSLVSELCDALACAHEFGAVHGDIAPSHLLVDGAGHLRALGFGLGQLAQPLGRRSYAAPEVLDGQPADRRSDVFSAGVIAYELITGRPLFDDHMDSQVRALVGARISMPSVLNGACPVAFEQVVMRALDTDPAKRWASARDMRRALETVGGPAPQVVRDWLQLNFDAASLPALTAPLPMPLSASRIPPPPPRTARGSGRMRSPVTPDPERPLTEPDGLHDAMTVLRAPTHDSRGDLQLPIMAPPEPYVVLEEDIEDIEVDFEDEDELPMPELALAVADWRPGGEPVPHVNSYDLSQHPRLRGGLPRRLELALAFCAGALCVYLLGVVFGG